MSDLFGLLRVFLEIDNSHEQTLDRIDRLALTEEAGAYVGKAALFCDHLDRTCVALIRAAAERAAVLDENAVATLERLDDLLGRILRALEAHADYLGAVIKLRFNSLAHGGNCEHLGSLGIKNSIDIIARVL